MLNLHNYVKDVKSKLAYCWKTILFISFLYSFGYIITHLHLQACPCNLVKPAT